MACEEILLGMYHLKPHIRIIFLNTGVRIFLKVQLCGVRDALLLHKV